MWGKKEADLLRASGPSPLPPNQAFQSLEKCIP
jgi:hypothetical protein